MFMLLLAGCLWCAGCRSTDTDVPPPESGADPGDSIWGQEGASFLGEGSSKILTDVESAIGEYIQQPPLTVGSLNDDLPLLTSTPRGVLGIEIPPPDEEQLIIMPLPFIDATIGAGLGLSVGLVRQPTEGLDRPRLSVLGFGGFASLNGSWGLGLGYRTHTADGEYRLLLGAGLARMRYDFFGIGTEAGDREDPADLDQRLFGIAGHGLKQIFDDWYLGPRLSYEETRSHVRKERDLSLGQGLALSRELDARTVGIGALLQHDTRVGEMLPTGGTLGSLGMTFYRAGWGSDFNYQVVDLSVDHYIEVADREILALRGMVRSSSGDVPFFDLSLFGSGPDLRGYVVGQYRDNTMFAVQAEYRYYFDPRVGMTVFAGLGEVSPRITQWSSQNLLHSVGVGVRYLVSRKHRSLVRLDFAFIRNGFVVLLGIGEEF